MTKVIPHGGGLPLALVFAGRRNFTEPRKNFAVTIPACEFSILRVGNCYGLRLVHVNRLSSMSDVLMIKL